MGRAGAWHGMHAIACAAVLLVGCWVMLGAGDGARAQAQSVVRVPILVFHNIDYSGSGYAVTPELLDAMCRWLIDNGYTTISLWQFYDAAFNGGWLPPNPVLLTNDDGWTSAVTFAGILGAYGMIGNYFIPSYTPLTADQILLLAQNGPVQDHTATHQYMSGLDYDHQLQEILGNKAYLEGITGQPVNFLAWPFGDSAGSAAQAATDAGMIAAFSLGGHPCYIGALDAYQIPRIMIDASDTLDSFAAKVTAW